MNPPGWLPRILSLVYESILVAALLMVAGFVFQPLHGVLPAPVARVAQAIYLLAVLAAYFGWCWLRSGQTLAMKTWRIRLVDWRGGAVSMRSALIRFSLGVLVLWLLAIVAWWGYRHQQALPSMLLVLAVFALNWCWILFDAERQTLLDRLAGTRLIKAS